MKETLPAKFTTIELLGALLEQGVSCTFEARGSSMNPFIKNGDLITISPLFCSAPEIGEVVAFRDPADRLLVHRVVGKKRQGYLIKGDNVENPDGVIQSENILGRLTAVRRNGRKIRFGFGPERFLILALTRRRAFFSAFLSLGLRIRSMFRHIFPLQKTF